MQNQGRSSRNNNNQGVFHSVASIEEAKLVARRIYDQYDTDRYSSFYKLGIYQQSWYMCHDF